MANAGVIAVQDLFARFAQRQLAGPLLILAILAMMVLPLPPFALDLFFTFNIAISVIVMLVAMSVMKPLDFSVFPTVLLVTTLLRLSLNVASTRVVLLEGHTGPGAAGQVIEAFGHFLVGGNYAVGLVVFTILVIINFVVITKGAGRVAEVAARFTLDAMPGKQMAIDADLNAGLIGEDEARKRRATIAEEADFFGSMDGASKFVRGDAVAGILIMLINVVGGLFVGVLQHDMDIAAAAKTYTLLTIGDGLVAQIPALIISIAAGMVVTRVGDGQDVSQQFIAQLFTNPRLIFLTAGIIGLLGLIPGMPNFVFLLLAVILAAIGWRLERGERAVAPLPVAAAPLPAREAQEASWADVTALDILGLEVGYRLIPLVDKSQDGELLRRIRGIRKKFAQEVGFLVSPVHIRDNLELKPNAYKILLKGVEIGAGEAFPGNLLAINPGRVAGQVPGTATKDPAYGLPAVWIEPALREQAQAYGYTVVDASTVTATHLNQLILSHAAELLGRQETQALLDHLAKEMPKLVEDVVPKLLTIGVFQKVLRNLLEEGVSLRDMRTIIETLAEVAPRSQDAEVLTAQVRIALGRSIAQELFPGGAEMQVMSLDPQLERILLQAVAGGGDGASIEPGLADTLLREAVAAAQRQEEVGLPTVLLVPGNLRTLLSRFLRRSIPQLKVLAHGEVPENRIIRVTSIIGGRV
ncbi:MAG: flagellar biosynthesis protein FlhA [Candidatus Accumulibacter sp.]|jgi:flagellar biosynthesis protein FlhA|uniref:flagellar biosynthesis protein FlhA n=1 Tax=unclassified Candidatus Accumulibacter TaxID=2619054 RepID=UPI0012CB1D0D|nr:MULTISPECIES: flagellar biosynthesis protein FlhA [unclassified Candidatus Accumulibacter]MBL8368881.1 flagellar biosynthesis protein FlhA [Accumulibacter sp.]MBN8512874.1 flagellar biosynthesis protein FlhA [Accumulibacter sp.]MQM35016.1 flagellar biosynthesis protein FlhA [Candidatus Accumulibacter phosphatis]HRI93219.1 flagellar biosynthesis protein FlhA [Accumulibacter sp.]